MENLELEKLRFPLGKFNFSQSVSNADIENYISEIERLPIQIQAAVEFLTEEELKLIYRPDGWNIRQLVNHLIDSHSNSVIRFKLALTEEVPTIKPYEEEHWALLADTEFCPKELSLSLLTNLHLRWTILLKSLTTEDWERKLFHPGMKQELSLKQLVALYAWHGKHHLAHIELAKKSNK